MTVGLDSLPRIERDAGLFEADPLHGRRTADRDEHEVALDALVVPEAHVELRSGVVDLGALLAEVDDDPALRECLSELAGRVRVLLRNEALEHLDDGDVAAEALEDRRELAADDPATQDHESLRDLGLREQARRVHAARRVDPANRRAHGVGAGGDDRARERDPRFLAFEHDRARVLEATDPLEGGNLVCLEEQRDAARHLLHDGVLPLVRLVEVEGRLAPDDSEPRVDLPRRVQRVRRLDPGLRRDAADAKTGSPELRLLLDTDGAGPELSRTNRCGVAGRAGAEDGDVELHRLDSIDRRSEARDAWSRCRRRPRGRARSHAFARSTRPAARCPRSAARLTARWPSAFARSYSAFRSASPMPPPRRLGTTAIASSGVSSSTNPYPG